MARLHTWKARLNSNDFVCRHCDKVTDQMGLIAMETEPCAPPSQGAVPIANIASARVAKAQYAKDISPADCLRATLAELEQGLPCSSLIIVIGNAGPATAATTLRLAGGTNYYERVGLIESAKEVLVRDAALPTERS